MDLRNTSRRGLRIVVFWLVVCLVVALDQATKAAVRTCVPKGRHTLVPGLLDVRLVHNTGAAFSLGEGAGLLFVIVAVVVVALALVVVWRQDDLPLSVTVSISCVAGGGIGNMVDRILFGYVTDFLATTFVDFPVFNVADVFVTVGVAATLVGFLVRDRRAREADELERVGRADA